jgi:transposase
VLDRHDLTDEEWARLEPLLPDRSGQRGGRWADHRSVINGVLWRSRCGLPWRDLSPDYGPRKTVYNRHRRWSADQTWERVLHELRRDADNSV